MRKARIVKDIKIAKHKFLLEIYLALEGHRDICWEIFPQDHQSALYAFENKQKIEKIIERKHLYEPINRKDVRK